MVELMKALVKAKPEEGIWMEDVPVPAPGANDVLIRVHKTAICGTDIHIYNWDEWARRTIPVPMVVGHEFSGEIVEVGSGGVLYGVYRYILLLKQEDKTKLSAHLNVVEWRMNSAIESNINLVNKHKPEIE